VFPTIWRPVPDVAWTESPDAQPSIVLPSNRKSSNVSTTRQALFEVPVILQRETETRRAGADVASTRTPGRRSGRW
jgi:hypothetical protein